MQIRYELEGRFTWLIAWVDHLAELCGWSIRAYTRLHDGAEWEKAQFANYVTLNHQTTVHPIGEAKYRLKRLLGTL